MSEPFVDMMMSEALLTRTENNAVTYAGSGKPLVDFFFQASPPSSARCHSFTGRDVGKSAVLRMQV